MMETREGRDEGLEKAKPYVREKEEKYLARGRRQGGKETTRKGRDGIYKAGVVCSVRKEARAGYT